jgi:hypothetical protein
MKWTLLFCFLVILGCAAVPAHAQTLTDPSYILHGSPCVEAFCVDLEYTGPTTCFNIIDCFNPTPPPLFDTSLPPTGSPFLFALATPITGIPFADFGLFNCSAVDLPGLAVDDFTSLNFTTHTGTFLGCDYFGILTSDQTFTWNSTVTSPLSSDIPGIVVVPEPNSFVLFMSGLALFCLAGFARKRFGANFSA